ncbi:MAG: beta-ketoacyl-ACP synthase II [Thiohalomonadales bacterium]
MSKRRVVITGLGMVSPVGLDVKSSWESILAGKSGIAQITHLDTTGFNTTIGGSIKNFDVLSVLTSKEARRMDTFIHYGIAASKEALTHSGLEINDNNAHRVGVSIGSGIGGLPGIEKGNKAYIESGPRKISPFFVPSNIINMVSGNVSIKYGLKGPNIAISTACASATHSIGDAARYIEYGDADVMLAGGAEMATSPTGLGGFSAARALSTRNDDPETASRPWDMDRDGFVLSDGAGVVVIEELEHAKKRGATIYAEVTGYGMSGDAYHMTSPTKDGDGAKRCMELALFNAKKSPDTVNYINAHGTSTPAGDIAEVHAMKNTFGSYAHKLAISSTKSMTGHLLGAAGGIEAIFTALAIKEQVAPPTINIHNQDPECDLDFISDGPREIKIDVALSNSFGFGGTNGTIILEKFTD